MFKISEEAKYISDKLIFNGFKSYLVGGSVRDRFLNKEPKDFDLATNALPEQIIPLFPNSYQSGKAFPVVNVGDIEVATFRTEEAQSRHNVSFSVVNNIEDDLKRRDLTINAIAVNMEDNTVIDPFKGIDDINNKRVRFVGLAMNRINEDPLRILRAIRFCSQLGFTIHQEDIDVLMRNKDEILELVKTVSMERIYDESYKIITGKNVMYSFNLLKDLDILFYIFPSIIPCINFDGGKHHGETVDNHLYYVFEAMTTMKSDFDMRIAALLHDVGKPSAAKIIPTKGLTFYEHEVYSKDLARKDLVRLKVPMERQKRILSLIRNHMVGYDHKTKLSKYCFLINNLKEDRVDIRELMRLRLCDRFGNKAKKERSVSRNFKDQMLKIREIEKSGGAFTLKDLDFNGGDLIKMGFKPSPGFSKVLSSMLMYVVDGKVKNNKVDLINMFNRSRLIDYVRNPEPKRVSSINRFTKIKW